MINIPAHKQKLRKDDPDAKASLLEPRSVQKANSYQFAANAYRLPVRWIQFDHNIFGDNTKYYDHFASIGRPQETFIDALFYKKIPVETLLEQIDFYEIRIDLEKLWDASIFHKDEISRYIRYQMTENSPKMDKT